MEHRIILVREWDAQMSSSGCCGRLGGENHELGDADTYAHNRREMEAMGAVYMALKRELFDVDAEVVIVDPRNMVWLIPAILHDARRVGMPLGGTLSQLARGVSYNSVIADGRVLFHGHVPGVEEAVAAVRGQLGLSTVPA